MNANTLRVLVDFHSAEEDDHVVASLTFAAGPGAVVVPSAGDWILLDDAEGHICWGVVSGVEGRLVDVKVDWTTWRKANPVEISGRDHEGGELSFRSGRSATETRMINWVRV